MNNKFNFYPVRMLGAVEENYIKFMGDNSSKIAREFLDAFREEYQKSTKHKVHAMIHIHAPNRVVIETVKYNINTSSYIDSTLWLFTKSGNGKYDWTIDRYRL